MNDFERGKLAGLAEAFSLVTRWLNETELRGDTDADAGRYYVYSREQVADHCKKVAAQYQQTLAKENNNSCSPT